MTAIAAGLVAGWVVIRLLGSGQRFPWRIAQLSARRRGSRRPDRGTARRQSRPRWNARSQQRDTAADLSATVDLLVVAASAGHTLHTAIVAVGSAGSGPVAAALGRVAERFERGATLMDGIQALPVELGDQVRPLVATLLATDASGAPLVPALRRLADAERRRHRRRAEARVRRLPVLLLGPLVLLVLPAFVVLTIVPVVLTTARTGLAPVLGLLGPHV